MYVYINYIKSIFIKTVFVSLGKEEKEYRFIAWLESEFVKNIIARG